MKFETESRQYNVRGVLPVAKKMNNWQVAKGRFITADDVKNRRRFAFIGNNIKEQLFGKESNPVGKKIKIHGVSFLIVGVAVEKKMQISTINSRHDNQILIPLTTALQLWGDGKSLDLVFATPKKNYKSNQVVTEVRSLLAKRHRFDPDDKDALYIWSMLEGIDFLKYIVLGLQVFLGGVGVITLMIGAVSVMNIMYFVVTQRTREIGIRRAIGAFRRHIFQQLFLEALVLTFIGGLIGFGLGWSVNAGLSALVESLRSQNAQLMMLFSPENSMLTAMITVFFMVAAGFLAGLTPALRAMRLNIVESLRYE